MSQKLYEETNIRDIANAIREQNGTQNSYTVAQMGNAVRAIRTQPELETLTVTENGNYIPSANKDGFSSVNVNVESGEAVVQPLSVTQNGTYTPPSGVDGYTPVTVNVPTGSGNILTGTDAPSVNLGNNGDIYKRTFLSPTNINFVEYLRSTGTQYIDTGLYATQNTDIYVKFAHISDSDDSVFGCRTGSYGSQSKTLNINDTGSDAMFTKSQETTATGTSIGLSNDQIVEGRTVTKKIGNTYFFDTILNNVNSLVKLNQEPFISDCTIILFGMNVAAVAYPRNAKIYRLIVFESDCPVADYLPCLDGNGIACMWNSIAREYVYNDGTGDFLYGNPTVPTVAFDPVFYVKKNGVWEVIHEHDQL